MKSPNLDAAHRLDRLLRLQSFWSGALLAGWLMIILGGVAVFMTVRRTIEQLIANPKLSLTILPWMPAPPYFRILGAALLTLGIALVLFAAMWRRKG